MYDVPILKTSGLSLNATHIFSTASILGEKQPCESEYNNFILVLHYSLKLSLLLIT